MQQRYRFEALESRRLLSGGIDPTFGTNGVVAGYANILPSGSAQAVLATPNGDTLIAGSQLTDPSATSQTPKLLRLSPNGLVDATFDASSSASLASIPFSSIAAMVMQPDGKILVAGPGVADSASNVIVARFNSDGSVDSAFGDAGLVKSTFAAAAAITADPIAVEPDGKVVVAALTADGGFGVDRFTVTGAVDTTFATHGQFTSGATAYSLRELTGLALAGDGSILVGGDNGLIYVTRLTSSGAVDATFGRSGTATLDLKSDCRLAQVGLQSNGKIILGGSVAFSSYNPTNGAMLAARLTSAGVLDKSFGTHGITKVTFVDRGEPDPKTAVSSANGFAAALAIGRDDKVVLVGSAHVAIALDDGPSPPFSDFATVRLLASGKVDRSFGIAGKLSTGGGNLWLGDSNAASAVAITADGSIIAVGAASEGGAVVRYRANGSLDPQFGYRGRVGPFPIAPPVDMAAVQPDGKLVLASSSGVARLLTNGQLDSTFGDRGLALQKGDEVDGWRMNIVRDIVGVLIESDGKILVATSVVDLADNTGGTAPITLTRYNADGSIDRKFGRNGTAVVNVGAAVKADTFQSFTVQSNGKILVLSGTAISRLMPDGSPDLTFGKRGVAPVLAGDGGNFTQIVVGQGTISIFGVRVVPALELSDPGTSDLLMTELDGRGKMLTPVQSFAINSPNAKVTAFAQTDGSEWVFIVEATNTAIYKFEGASIDSGFNNGSGLISIPTKGDFTDYGTVLQSDGVYYFNGYTDSAAVIVALNNGGLLDSTFGTNGVLTLPPAVAVTQVVGSDDDIYLLGIDSIARITP